MTLGGVPVSELFALMQAHLFISSCAVLGAVLLGLPIAIWAARGGGAGRAVISVISLAQTIPGLALLALFYPLLILARQATGLDIPALGFLPAVLALGVYALLPVVRNGAAALRGIDPLLIEAADGVGLTARQKLTIVELPLGAPVILAGIRTAAVWTIGTATLATTIGQSSLGDLIFSGLQTENWQRVLVGCFAAAALALGIDAVLALIERGLGRRSRWQWGTGLALLLAAVLASLAPGPESTADQTAPGQDQRAIIIGAKNFSEQYILARAIETRLQAAGFKTVRREGLGSAIAYSALAAGDIDIYVDYSGTLWSNTLERQDNVPGQAMIDTLTAQLKSRDGITVVGPLGFENAYAFAMKRSRATALKIATLADLAEQANTLRLASDLEFLSRPEWASVQKSYGLGFSGTRAYSPTFMYRALETGAADVISAFSSDGRIAAQDLVILTDPRGALPRYDALLLVSAGFAGNPRLMRSVEPMIGSISIEKMREANWMVDRDSDKRFPEDAARWLADKP